MMTRFRLSKEVSFDALESAFEEYLLATDYTNECEVDENGKPIPSFELVNHMAMLSISCSLMAIADRLITVGDELHNLLCLLDRRLP